MRPSLTRCVLPCVALCLPACHAGGDEFTGDELTVGGSGSNSAPKTTGDTAGNDTPPFPTTLPPDPEDASGESGGDTTTSSADDSDDDDVSPACPPPDVGVDLVPFNAACDIPLQLGGFEPVVEWKWGDGQFCGPPVAGQTIDTNASGDLDDGDLPLVFLYRGDDVVALWGDGSGVAWQAEGFYGGYSSGLALGDLDGDGWPEIVTINNSAACALDARDGSEKWCSVHLGDSIDGNGTNYPAIADMDGDGQAEVVIGPKILSSTGQVIGTGKPGKGSSPWLGDPNITAGALSAVVDLDGDGVQEVVTGNAAYDLDGNSVWQNGGLDGFVAVADFDLDGAGEIVKISGVQILGMESDGAEVWGPIGFAGNLGPPAIDDLDGDGVPDIVVGALDKLVAMRWGGEPLWTATIEDISGSAGPVLFDFEKDGFPEVLIADEVAVRFFSGLDGSLKFLSTAHASNTQFETPIVADVDGDDQAEIVLGHCSGDADIGAITVYGDAGGSWPPGRKIWNQHTYHISNIGDLGRVPADYRSNWLGDDNFNSFRSGDIGQRPGEFHDLQAEIVAVCEAACHAGSVSLTARVRNAGTLDVPAGIGVTVRAGDGGPIVAARLTAAPIPATTTGELLTFVLDAADLADTVPFVTVDESGAGGAELFECDEQNNSVSWSAPVCALP
jgi:hypothetical protein